MKHALLLLCPLVVLPTLAAAQNAKITGLVLSVTCRASASAPWAKARLGMQLASGAQVRTGKRSQCEIRFPDGSLARLGPLSDLTITRVAGKDLSMGSGKLYARIVKGTTARIQGGTSVASIKGTVLEFDAGDPATPVERRANVLTIIEGLAELTGTGGTQLVQAGSQSQVAAGGAPSGLTSVPGGGFSKGSTGQWWDGMKSGAAVQATPSSAPALQQRQQTTDSGRPPWSGAPGQLPQENGAAIIDIQSAQVSAHEGQKTAARAGSHLLALALPPPSAMLEVPPVALLQTPGRAFGGKRFYGLDTTVDLFGLLSTENSMAGMRVRPNFVWGECYFEFGATGWVTEEESWQTKLTEAFLQTRPPAGDITIGRQHFIAGPVNNSNLGSLIGFYTADALRWQPQAGTVSLDLALISDFRPLFGDHQRGLYARAESPLKGGSLGANTTYYEDVGTGWSLDLSLPLIEGTWDMYGEYGRDPVGNDLQTVGWYFPDLYQKHDIDLFVEWAHRERHSSMGSVNAYRDFGRGWTGFLQVQVDTENDTTLNVGAIKSF